MRTVKLFGTMALVLIAFSMLGFGHVEGGEAFLKEQEAGCGGDCVTLDDTNLAEVSMSSENMTEITSSELPSGLEPSGKAVITDSSVLNFGFTPATSPGRSTGIIGTFKTINIGDQ